jgi:hypothetical protein
MKQIDNAKFSMSVRRAAIALIATGAVAAPAAQAMPGRNLIVVPPTALPQLARQGGDAMLLHDTADGRTLLYVERDAGGRLAIFDVTDPASIKACGQVQLDAPGAFDFVSVLGDNAELIRFRAGQGSAVLDLYHAQAPTVTMIEGHTLQGQVSVLGADGITASTPVDNGAQPARDYQVIDTATAQQLKPVADVKQVRQEIVNRDSGTTFLLTDNGLYLIRRPAVELQQQQRALDYGN